MDFYVFMCKDIPGIKWKHTGAEYIYSMIT